MTHIYSKLQFQRDNICMPKVARDGQKPWSNKVYSITWYFHEKIQIKLQPATWACCVSIFDLIFKELAWLSWNPTHFRCTQRLSWFKDKNNIEFATYSFDTTGSVLFLNLNVMNVKEKTSKSQKTVKYSCHIDQSCIKYHLSTYIESFDVPLLLCWTKAFWKMNVKGVWLKDNGLDWIVSIS